MEVVPAVNATENALWPVLVRPPRNQSTHQKNYNTPWWNAMQLSILFHRVYSTSLFATKADVWQALLNPPKLKMQPFQQNRFLIISWISCSCSLVKRKKCWESYCVDYSHHKEETSDATVGKIFKKNVSRYASVASAGRQSFLPCIGNKHYDTPRASFAGGRRPTHHAQCYGSVHRPTLTVYCPNDWAFTEHYLAMFICNILIAQLPQPPFALGENVNPTRMV